MSEPFKSRPYQREAIRLLLARAHMGLLMDPGLGKTACALSVIVKMQAKANLGRTLVVAPLRPCYSVWPDEILKWDHTQHLTHTILHGTKKESRIEDEADVYLINYEGLGWLIKTGCIQRRDFDWLILDESTAVKNSRTQRFKLLKSVAACFVRRTILTGSPIPNGMLDLFGQIYMLDQGQALGRYVTHYRNKYFVPTGYGGYTWLPQYDAEERIYAAVKNLVVSYAAKDHLDLPPLTEVSITVDLPKRARQIYDDMLEAFIAENTDEHGRLLVTAANAGVRTTKLRQIGNGGVFDNDGTAHHVHDAKADAVASIVEQLQGQPALVAYEFAHDLARLQRVLKPIVGHDVPYVGGGVSGPRGDALFKALNAGELRVLLVQPQSVSKGLNLQVACHHLIYHSLIWSLDDHDQLIKRLHRSGQKNAVVVHYVIARDTIDDRVRDVLEGKARTQNDFLAALRSHINDRQRRRAA